MQITIEHLTKQFGNTTAVNDLSITLESGKLIALLGPSGCGKSTTLNMLSGILPVTSGRVLFDGKDVTALPPEKRGIGLVFQNYALYPHMTARQNICFPMEIKKIPKKQRLERAAELAELVHITPYLDRKPAELSGGQQQRVAIARALAKDPQVLLLDEPLSNLDAKLRVEMREEIRRIQRESKITTVFVTHDQEEASSIADQVVLLRDGIKQQEDTARGLYENPVNFFVADFLGTPPINKLHGKIAGGKIRLEGYPEPISFAPASALADDLPVVLAVRAEGIVPGAQSPAFTTKVLERYSLGKDELVRLAVGETQQMRGFVPAELDIQAGDMLPLGLKNRGVFLFHAETGERYI
ncbi:MAG: ABC transporter ATP-binding protein [Clostridiales bacterium]|nr:ABC transporter ATP-binding protein [Clostridiales bacterium]